MSNVGTSSSRTGQGTWRQPWRRNKKNGKRSLLSRIGRPPSRSKSVVKPSKYIFKRTFDNSFEMNPGAIPANWAVTEDGFYRNWVFDLQQLPGYTDFTNLFAQYRLVEAEVSLYFSDTSSDNVNRQMIVYTKPNQAGQPVVLTEGDFLQSQATTRKLALTSIGEPLVYKMPLKQLTQMWRSVATTDYTLTAPKYISTNEPGTPHFGLDMRVQRVSDESFGAGVAFYPYVKCLITLTVECKQVH